MSRAWQRQARRQVRADRLTVNQLLAEAKRDTDPVSVFYDGSGPHDTDTAIVVVKGKKVVDGVIAMLHWQGLMTDEPVGEPATADVANYATCCSCGCTDRQACAGGCYWLAVDRVAKSGVCSNCQPALAAWRNQRVQP